MSQPFPNTTSRATFKTEALLESPTVLLHDVDAIGNEILMVNDGVDPTIWDTVGNGHWTDHYITMEGGDFNTLTSNQALGSAFTDAWSAINPGIGFTMCWWMRSTSANQTVIFHTKNSGDGQRLTIRLTDDLEFNFIQLIPADNPAIDIGATYADGRYQIFPATPQVNDGNWHFVSIGYRESELFSFVVDNEVILDNLSTGNGLGAGAFDADSTIGFAPTETWGDTYDNYTGDIADFMLIPEMLTVTRMRELFFAGDHIARATRSLDMNTTRFASGDISNEDAVKFKNNEVSLAFEADVFDHQFTDWQLRREHEASASINIRTTSSGTAIDIANVTNANLTRLDMVLDKSENYYVRVRENAASWSDWVFMDLSGEIRSITGKHRDTTTVTETSAGATVQTSNPKWTETATSTGVQIVNNVYNQEQSRIDLNAT